MLNLDFSSVPNRAALPEGVYTVQVAKVEEAVSSAGNPMIKVEFDVLEVEGSRKLWDNFVLIDKSLWKMKEFLGALGFDTSSSLEFDIAELVGEVVQAKVIVEQYNGDDVNRVKKYLQSA